MKREDRDKTKVIMETQAQLFNDTEAPSDVRTLRRAEYSRNKGIDHLKSVELAKKGLSHAEIAKLQGCSPPNITHVLQRYGVTEPRVRTYKDYRADILAGLQERLLSSVTKQDIEKAPLGSRVLAAAQLYDKERLERGLATEQISVHSIIQDHADIGDEIAKLEAKLASLMGDKP